MDPPSTASFLYHAETHKIAPVEVGKSRGREKKGHRARNNKWKNEPCNFLRARCDAKAREKQQLDSSYNDHPCASYGSGSEETRMIRDGEHH